MLPAIGGIIGGGLGLLGSLFGGGGEKSSKKSWLGLDPMGALESSAYSGQGADYSQLRQMVDQQGNGNPERATGTQNDLFSMLRQYSQTGGLPQAQDISTGNDYAKQLFQSRQTGLDQAFKQQGVDASRLAASMGRDVNDPILQAKLRTGYMQQQDQLNSDQGSYGAQLALSLPGQRLGYLSQANDLASGLAAQAFQNRATLLGMGSGILNQERNFRINTATQYGEGESSKKLSGSDIMGNILGGIGGGMSIGNSLGGLFGGGAAAAGGGGGEMMSGGSAADYGAGSGFSNNSSMAPWMTSSAPSASRAPAFGPPAPSYSSPKTLSLGQSTGGGFGGSSMYSGYGYGGNMSMGKTMGYGSQYPNGMGAWN